MVYIMVPNQDRADFGRKKVQREELDFGLYIGMIHGDRKIIRVHLMPKKLFEVVKVRAVEANPGVLAVERLEKGNPLDVIPMNVSQEKVYLKRGVAGNRICQLVAQKTDPGTGVKNQIKRRLSGLGWNLHLNARGVPAIAEGSLAWSRDRPANTPHFHLHQKERPLPFPGISRISLNRLAIEWKHPRRLGSR
jgi:hypothetical protein